MASRLVAEVTPRTLLWLGRCRVPNEVR